MSEQAAILVDRLRRHPLSTFRGLITDCDTTLLVVARFLALLELYREGSVAFDQVSPLGELHVRWTGPSEGEIEIVAEEYDGAAPEPELDPDSAVISTATQTPSHAAVSLVVRASSDVAPTHDPAEEPQ